MPAVRRDTLAPWVLRVRAATSRRASSRMRGRPGDRRETGRRTRAGQGTPAPLVPVLTSVRPTIGTWPTAPPRRCANVPPQPGRPGPPAGQDHRRAGPCPAVPRCRGACPPVAGRPGAVPGRPRPCHPVAGQPRVGQPVAGRPGAAPGRPRPCHPVAAPDRLQPGQLMAGQPRVGQPVAGRPGAAPGPPRPRQPVAGRQGAPRDPTRTGHLVTAPGRRRPRRRAVCPTPATAVPGR